MPQKDPAMFNKTDAEKRARGEILRLNEMDDPPTPDQMRLFLSDPEIDFTPTELVKWLRELKARMQGNHRHCAGCPLCSDLWVLEHNADYLELACIVIDSAADRMHQLVLALAEVEAQTARNDEAEAQLAYIGAGCVNATRDELVKRITAVGTERYKVDDWLASRLDKARKEGEAASLAEVERLGILTNETEIEWGYQHSQGINACRSRAEAEAGVRDTIKSDQRRQLAYRGRGALVQRRKASDWTVAASTEQESRKAC